MISTKKKSWANWIAVNLLPSSFRGDPGLAKYCRAHVASRPLLGNYFNSLIVETWIYAYRIHQFSQYDHPSSICLWILLLVSAKPECTLHMISWWWKSSKGCKHKLLADCQYFRSLQFICLQFLTILLYWKTINNNNKIKMARNLMAVIPFRKQRSLWLIGPFHHHLANIWIRSTYWTAYCST